MTSEIEAAGRLRPQPEELTDEQLHAMASKLQIAAETLYGVGCPYTFQGDDYPQFDEVDICHVMQKWTDPRPVDEAFAKRIMSPMCTVNDDGRGGYYSRTYRLPKQMSLLHVTEPGNGEWELHIGNDKFIRNPTIGQFWTAMRLFQVTLTQTGAGT